MIVFVLSYFSIEFIELFFEQEAIQNKRATTRMITGLYGRW